MVYIRLARKWTDGAGVEHAAGDSIDVDAVTLANLEADGVVDPNWAGSTGMKPGSPAVPTNPAQPVPTSPAPKQPVSGAPTPGTEWAGST